MFIIGPLVNFRKDLLPALEIITRSVIVIHYGKYGKLLEGQEDQLILDNNKIAGDVEDVGIIEDIKNAGKAEDAKDAEKVENVEDGGDTKDVREIGNVGDVGDIRDTKDKEAGRSNNKATDKGNQNNGEVGNAEIDDNRDQKASK